MPVESFQPDERLPKYYDQPLSGVDFRQHPELYRIGKGEQGVLMVEPYKSEILPYWRFKNPDVAKQSSERIYAIFLEYLRKQEFAGADMARKFLQMGYTRARRYANHRSGRKYARNPQKEMSAEAEKTARKEALLPNETDPVKAQAAAIFKAKWEQARQHPEYLHLRQLHRQKYETK